MGGREEGEGEEGQGDRQAEEGDEKEWYATGAAVRGPGLP